MTVQDSDAESHKTSDLPSTRSTTPRPYPEEPFDLQPDRDTSDTDSITTQMPLRPRNNTRAEQQSPVEPPAAESHQGNSAAALETRISELQTRIQSHQTQLDGLTARVNEQEVAFAQQQRSDHSQRGSADGKAKALNEGKGNGPWKPKSRRERILMSYLKHF